MNLCQTKILAQDRPAVLMPFVRPPVYHQLVLACPNLPDRRRTVAQNVLLTASVVLTKHVSTQSVPTPASELVGAMLIAESSVTRQCAFVSLDLKETLLINASRFKVNNNLIFERYF